MYISECITDEQFPATGVKHFNTSFINNEIFSAHQCFTISSMYIYILYICNLGNKDIKCDCDLAKGLFDSHEINRLYENFKIVNFTSMIDVYYIKDNIKLIILCIN